MIYKFLQAAKKVSGKVALKLLKQIAEVPKTIFCNKLKLKNDQGEFIFMNAKAKIKVIKKSELENTETPDKVEQKPKKTAAREMVNTVSNWVSDFQQRRSKETKLAIEKFFSNQPKTSEM